MSFKGNKVVIREMHYEKGMLEITAAFVDEKGVAHGEIRHRRPPGVGDPGESHNIYGELQRLLQKVEGWVSTLHYDNVGIESLERPQASFGIAESLEEAEDSRAGIDPA